MTVISVPSLRPLEPRKAAALNKVILAAQDCESQPMLVGAFARDVWFWHVYGIETERATEDIDISMAFSEWDGFRHFAETLKTAGFVQPVPNHPEKLLDPETGQKMDLLPFGALSEDGRSIIWPVDQSRWSVLGFEESHQSAVRLSVSNDGRHSLRMVTLPSMVMLKMVAFYERLQDRKRKDGADISFTLANYLLVGNRKRLEQGHEAIIMDEVDGDIQRAGAVLLGRDIGRVANPVTRLEVITRLKSEADSASRCPLARELMQRLTRGDFHRARDLLRDVLNGVESV